MPDLKAIQDEAWRNKVQKGFNTTDPAVDFGLLTAEVSEAFIAWYRGEDVAEELADVVIYAAGLATMLGIRLDEAVADKLRINAARRYRQLPNGTYVKCTETPAESQRVP
jgi:NTP pyrophosphatase (non-canonical NTP hydrolase)